MGGVVGIFEKWGVVTCWEYARNLLAGCVCNAIGVESLHDLDNGESRVIIHFIR